MSYDAFNVCNSMFPAKKSHMNYDSLVYSLIPKCIPVKKDLYLVLMISSNKILTLETDGKSDGKGVILKRPCERQKGF